MGTGWLTFDLFFIFGFVTASRKDLPYWPQTDRVVVMVVMVVVMVVIGCVVVFVRQCSSLPSSFIICRRQHH